MIKFWPNKKTHRVDVEVTIPAGTIRFSLDLEEAAEASVDFADAIEIVTTDWIEE